MTVAAGPDTRTRLTVVEFDPLRDKSYRETALGPEVVAWLAWLETGGAAETTLDSYERVLSRACHKYPATPLAKWTDAQLLQVAKTFGAKERRTRVAAIKSFFRWARRTRRITENPCDLLPTIKRPPRKVYDIFGAAEVTALATLPVRDGTLFELMFSTGARKGDCCNLRFRHWRSEATLVAPYGMVVFHEGKGGKDRQVPASEALARKLAELAILDGLKPNDFLWYTRPGGGSEIRRSRPLGDGSFDRWWRRSLAEAGVRYRNQHLTRHTFATNFLRSPRGRLETLQMILGHESIQTTSDLYGHLDMRDIAYDMGLTESIRSER